LVLLFVYFYALLVSGLNFRMSLPMLRNIVMLFLALTFLSGFILPNDLHAQKSVNASAGCQSTTVFDTGVTEYELESGGQTRSYLLYVPDSFDPEQPTPLVLTFHGFAGWPAQQMENSNWRQVADENGILVAYPAGTGFPLRWRIGQDFNEANDSTDDLKFISDLLDELSDQFCLDLNRIYANGLSNGGGMTYLLACEMADRFAAVGTVAGAYIEPEGGCQPSRPIPVMTFHGTDDEIVPYMGIASRQFNFPRISDWVKEWSSRNGCDNTPEPLPDVGEVSGIEYLNCDEEVEVVFYTVNGGGHSWPGGEPMPRAIVGHTTDDIDASAVMWEFFQQHPLQ
jgi:polyhydroxybutyrate depolymerase